MLKFKEIETKYKAENISIDDFIKFCRTLGPKDVFSASGNDRFYASATNPDCFCRHRKSPEFNQLSFKRKTLDKNNFIRTEYNIALGSEVSEDEIEAICSEFGYQYNTTLFKNCFIYTFDRYTLVYYVCYDNNLKELARFIEIEMSETHPWESEETAWKELLLLEESLKPLGISPQARVKRSLFEMFRK